LPTFKAADATEGEFMTTFSRSIVALAFAIALAIPTFAHSQKSDAGQDDHFDVRSSVGDLHVGKDADAQKTGLPLYPGARPKRDKDNDPVNLGIFTEAFGFKIVVAKYESDDAPGKVIDYYRDRLKKYGKVLECHTKEHGGNAHADFDDDKDKDSKGSKELKCEGDNTGPVTELKVGREDNQHVVAIEPTDGHTGSTFALLYVYTRGKHGDI
jgi:hypothetical protein